MPDDDPSNSDEEYYEHPLFSSQWTASSVLPSGPAQSAEAHLGREKGEPSMVPLAPPPLPAALTTCITLSVPPCVGGSVDTVLDTRMHTDVETETDRDTHRVRQASLVAQR